MYKRVKDEEKKVRKGPFSKIIIVLHFRYHGRRTRTTLRYFIVRGLRISRPSTLLDPTYFTTLHFSNLFAGPNGEACKSLYPWIAKYEESGKDYVETNDFRVLCLRLVQTVAIFLDEIGEKAKVEVFLYKLGQRHVDYLPRDTKEEFFDMLRDATHEGFNVRVHSLGELTDEERNRAIQLWTDSVDYIFNMVKEGFFDGLKGFDRFPGIEKWALVQYPVPSPEFHPTMPENHF